MNRWVLQHEESIIMVAITCAVISYALFFVADDVVAQAQPAAAPVAFDNCVPWMQAGQWTLRKCVDEKTDEVKCVSSDSGMLSCKWDE